MAAESPDQAVQKCRGAALEAARRPDTGQFPHEHIQIRPRRHARAVARARWQRRAYAIGELAEEPRLPCHHGR